MKEGNYDHREENCDDVYKICDGRYKNYDGRNFSYDDDLAGLDGAIRWSGESCEAVNPLCYLFSRYMYFLHLFLYL